MKILHTADWHLGKLVHQLHMTQDQSYILDEFIRIVKEEKPDAVIIAGDLYDRAVPPKEAVELLNETLMKLIYDIKVPVLAITGNHDSPDRLNFGSTMFRKQQFYLQAKLDGALEPVTLQDEHGDVHFYLIPYIEPADARAYFEDESIQTHHDAMSAIVERIENDNQADERQVLIAHAFMAGGMESESEERLTMLGGTPYIDAGLFSAFSYVALGHLHQPQRVTDDKIRYAGSLLKYSFSEANHKKGVTLVELDENGVSNIREEKLTPKHDMRIKEGYLNDLLEENDGHSEDYLHIKLLDDGQLMDPMGKLRKVYPNVLSLERVGFLGQHIQNQRSTVKERQQMSHEELFESFYKEVKGKDLDNQRKKYVSETIQNVLAEERGQ
ncbi:exonuclease SbcCD subunit D [Pontibacillus marinus]|uniref:Nuclease SbcCD subunit D n=1 Tax=Pontibacillus marinus BH030004 = DSM 16465 TaxID=1385511 RepID=A0A0A5HNN9_9BACI|nr:exonuclease SbcCD subunit D [Pontibacillus marinus]KGX85257.1 exonuclease SbcD [Pontibacillus marinus BH030004 = DSM 16465]